MKNNIRKYLSEIGEDITPYQWEKGDLTGYLRFDTNTLPWAPEGIDTFLESLKNNCPINEYGDPGYFRLRQLIADYEKVKPEMISITNSGDEAIDILGKAFLNPGDYFITTPPTYEVYSIQCNINKGKLIEVPLTRKNFSIQEEKIIKIADKKKVKLIFICNPNNPTSTVIPQEKIFKILKKTGKIVVVDEVYREFYEQSSMQYLSQFNNLVILRSFSKFASLAGARVGYLISNRSLIKIFEGLRLPMGVSFLSCKLAEFVLERKRDFINRNISLIIREREKLKQELLNLGFEVYPSQTNFLLVKIGLKAGLICRELKDRKILVRNRSGKKYLEGCVRITVRSKEENDQLITAIKEIL